MPTHKHWRWLTLSQAALVALALFEIFVICWWLQVGTMHNCFHGLALPRLHDEFIEARH
jgi:hypothetical protein